MKKEAKKNRTQEKSSVVYKIIVRASLLFETAQIAAWVGHHQRNRQQLPNIAGSPDCQSFIFLHENRANKNTNNDESLSF